MLIRARLTRAVLSMFVILAAVRMATTGSASAAESPPGQTARADSVLGIFEGRTPCGMVATEFTGFPAQGCEKIKWRLTLYRTPANGPPWRYRYEGTRTTRQGHWRIGAAAGSGRGRTVYHLTPAGPGGPLSLISVDDKVLLLLDEDGRVLIGDASWSYALNRVELPRRIGSPD